jgi:N-acetylneuraminate synthase
MTRIIAEAGVNHNGDEKLAFQLIDAAFEAGADVVKFQTFRAANLASKGAKQAKYQAENSGKEESQLEMLSRLELNFDVYQKLAAYCSNLGIEFLSTAFDDESLLFLVKDLKLKTLKIPSGEITNAPFVLKHAQTGCDLIVSTGMASLSEIEAALGVIAFGYTADASENPTTESFQTAYLSAEGQNALRRKVTLLHCTTEYPAPMHDINLNAMSTMSAAFGLATGYSDHSAGITVPIAATALGAVLIEKHFTLDKTMEGPDHKASLEPNELRQMVVAIHSVRDAMGDGVKGPRLSELKNKAVARKSLVAAGDIVAGEPFTASNITIKRPGNGITPYLYWDFIGKTARRSYSEGDLILE